MQTNRYKIICELNKGGQGQLFLGEDLWLGHRTVVIKRPLSSKNQFRFEREVAIMAMLNHPGILQLWDIERDRKSQMIRSCILPYVEGESLQEKLRRLPRSVNSRRAFYDRLTLIPFLIQACKSNCIYASKNIIHMDLKPDHIMIDKYRHTYVIDWGLSFQNGVFDQSLSAKIAVENDGVAQRKYLSNTLVGTPPYMSPESLKGEKIDRKSDLWSLGVILYKCLTGHFPFIGLDLDAISSAVLYSHAIRPRKINRYIPKSIEELIMILLSKETAKRNLSIQEIIDSLTRMI